MSSKAAFSPSLCIRQEPNCEAKRPFWNHGSNNEWARCAKNTCHRPLLGPTRGQALHSVSTLTIGAQLLVSGRHLAPHLPVLGLASSLCREKKERGNGIPL